MEEVLLLLKLIILKAVQSLVETLGWFGTILILGVIVILLAVFVALFQVARASCNALFAYLKNKYRNSRSRVNPAIAALTLITTAATVIGLLAMPYGYYILLRIAFCITGAVAYVNAQEQKRVGWRVAAGAIVLIYNPLMPLHLGDKALWIVLNTATVLVLWVGAHRLTVETQPPKQPRVYPLTPPCA